MVGIETIGFRSLPWRRMWSGLGLVLGVSVAGAVLSAAGLLLAFPWQRGAPDSIGLADFGEAWSLAGPIGFAWLGIFHLPAWALLRSGWAGSGLAIGGTGAAAGALFLLESSRFDVMPVGATLVFLVSHTVVAAAVYPWWDRRIGEPSPVGPASETAQLLFFLMALGVSATMISAGRGAMALQPYRILEFSPVLAFGGGFGIATVALIFGLVALGLVFIARRRRPNGGGWTLRDFLMAQSVFFVIQLVVLLVGGFGRSATGSGSGLSDSVLTPIWPSGLVAITLLALATQVWAGDPGDSAVLDVEEEA